MMASTRRASTDRGHRVENGKRSGHVVGVDPAGAVVGDAGRARGGGSTVGRSTVLRAVSGILPRDDRAAIDPDRDVSAVDVLEVPLQVGVRAVVPGGGGLDQLAAVLSDPAGRVHAASD